MVVPEPSPQLMILKFLFGLTLNSRSKWSNVMSPHTKLIKHLSTLLLILLPFNHIDASFLDPITNKDQETPISFWPPLELVELEPSLSNISKLTIRINNGSSMIMTGVFKTHLIHNLELIP
jgi:hypothetical protein